MPWVGGGESIPDLIELLGVALRDETSPRREHKFHTAPIIVSLERAAHQRIAADGTTISLAPDSDRPGKWGTSSLFAAEEREVGVLAEFVGAWRGKRTGSTGSDAGSHDAWALSCNASAPLQG
jgi:hypothetical protein